MGPPTPVFERSVVLFWSSGTWSVCSQSTRLGHTHALCIRLSQQLSHSIKMTCVHVTSALQTHVLAVVMCLALPHSINSSTGFGVKRCNKKISFLFLGFALIFNVGASASVRYPFLKPISSKTRSASHIVLLPSRCWPGLSLCPGCLLGFLTHQRPTPSFLLGRGTGSAAPTPSSQQPGSVALIRKME